MKVYMVYLTLSDEDFRKFDINITQDRGRFNKTDDGLYIGLYAFTKDKATFKAFANDRNLDKNKYFIKRVLKMDESRYDAIRDAYGYAELDMVKLRCSRDSVTWLPLTRDEEYNISYSYQEIISELTMDAVLVDYRIFTGDIEDSLDAIFYNHYRDIWYGSDADRDARSFNASFGIDPESIWGNQLGLFLYLYKDLISMEHIWENINNQMERGDIDEDD